MGCKGTFKKTAGRRILITYWCKFQDPVRPLTSRYVRGVAGGRSFTLELHAVTVCLSTTFRSGSADQMAIPPRCISSVFYTVRSGGQTRSDCNPVTKRDSFSRQVYVLIYDLKKNICIFIPRCKGAIEKSDLLTKGLYCYFPPHPPTQKLAIPHNLKPRPIKRQI